MLLVCRGLDIQEFVILNHCLEKEKNILKVQRKYLLKKRSNSVQLYPNCGVKIAKCAVKTKKKLCSYQLLFNCCSHRDSV